VAKPRSKEAKIPRYERGLFLTMKIAEDFLLILPFRPTNFESDLSAANLPAAQQLNLILRDVMIKNDQATALRLGVISFTIPRRIRERASLIAAGLIRL
jgi:hypothetical protein